VRQFSDARICYIINNDKTGAHTMTNSSEKAANILFAIILILGILLLASQVAAA
jgi:hypothetical protein